ncbi:ABC transporter substrate-binding protein [Bacillus swezeyi]|uniref:SgrR family transcriptional regulator n=1 Tax=Bacillus swezeyi TaxID=1925020 RepID=A0A1R1S0R1_9BACI|nr:SgrR family transcriptional regulator [Bacillus swezeyi]MEC1261623.1 ABC transporter substrate-binding protein [Bacillus swezeyi]MED2926514.1 ABC transporter substrate-binding protein [Bacillus swezeyi]MED2965923.1 ABC transporter substrate-binding protein [Bacillus swezeyi]MED2978546.1 ABC transporter substrate-binding protein [Bacillus swezeyi]MED3070673.1 ABC transporter substrate-binding protein [Bacillus swezeyi]
MKPIEHYMALTATLKCDQAGQTAEMSMKEAAGILFCTARNAKLILNKLEDLQWINWKRGLGRGIKSEVQFLKEPCALLFETAKNYTKDGKIGQARHLLQTYENVCPRALFFYKKWLNHVFGFQMETQNQQKKDVLRLITSLKPEHFERLDPSRIYLRSESHIVKQVFDTLLRFDEKRGGIQPHLAHHWECSADHKTWTFYLRKGVYFHHGKTLSAEDVRYTFERFLLDPQNKCKWLAEDIETIKIKDDYCFDICLKEKNALFLHHLCDERLSVLCVQHESGQLTGTGPFRLVRRDDRVLALEVHEHYFKGRAFLDRIELWHMETESRSHVLDYGFYIESEDQGRLFDEWYEERNVQYISVNLERPGPLQHRAFRKALKQIISPADMVNELAGQRTAPAAAFMNVSQPAEIKNNIHELLKECDYGGEPLKLYTFSECDHREDVSWIKERCRPFGIVVEVHHLEADELMRKDIILKADLIHDSATFSYSEEVSWLHLLLTENSFLHAQLSSEWKQKAKQVREDIRYIDDHEKRISLLSRVDAELVEEVCALPLYQNKMRVKAGEAIQGIALNDEGWINFYGIWFKKGERERLPETYEDA